MGYSPWDRKESDMTEQVEQNLDTEDTGCKIPFIGCSLKTPHHHSHSKNIPCVHW